MMVDGASDGHVDSVMLLFAQDKVDSTCFVDLVGPTRDDIVANSELEVKVGTSGFFSMRW